MASWQQQVGQVFRWFDCRVFSGLFSAWSEKVFDKLPTSLEGIKPVLLYPLFGILFTGLIMMYIIIEPVKGVNEAITSWLSSLGTGNLVMLGLLLGGMMAVDMGGPINKAAFTFGIAMIDAGNFAPHAAVMAGGMVPPLGLALATTFFKRKFSKRERDAGKHAILWAHLSLQRAQFHLQQQTQSE